MLENGVEAWATSAPKYVQEAMSNSESYFNEYLQGRKFVTKIIHVFKSEYDPLMDLSADPASIFLNYYQTQIGVLRWMVELGMIDIITEVFMLTSQFALPQEGHLKEVFQIFGYPKGHQNARMVFDPTYPTPDTSMFLDHDWRNFYGDVQQAIPTNAHDPGGKEVDLGIFFDSYHSGDKLTRQSRTGYIIFLKNAQISWLSKKQSTIETPVFGAEFVAMNIGMKTLQGLQYKLRITGVPI